MKCTDCPHAKETTPEQSSFVYCSKFEKEMKAWLVREKDEFAATVVFAETRGKAKGTALTTDCCEDVNYCNIEATRVPQVDKLYKDGKTELEWNNPKDRVALVRDCGFVCDYDCRDDCEECSAQKWCDYYKEEK